MALMSYLLGFTLMVCVNLGEAVAKLFETVSEKGKIEDRIDSEARALFKC